MRRLRLVCVLGIAAVAFGALGFGVIGAQAVEKISNEELPEGVKNAGEFAADWDGSGTHPGKAYFDNVCSTCHTLGEDPAGKAGPALAGLYERVEAVPYQGRSVQQRMLDYVKSVEAGGPLSEDPYFSESQKTNGISQGVDMTTLGGLPPDTTDQQILDIIDYILRFRGIDFSEQEYNRRVDLGRSLVSGDSRFKWGGPSCIGCHSIGSDPDLMGANIGPNIAHTYVLARQLGKDEKSNFADGVYEILSGESAPAAHYYYKDEEGSHPLTEGELLAVTTFFEQAARDTGTEKQSNYLPILGLLVAAFCILLMEPGVVNVLFAKEHQEYIDGPYEEEHHHDEPKPTVEVVGSSDEVAAETKPEEQAKQEAAEKPLPDDGTDSTPKPTTEVVGGSDEGAADDKAEKGDSEEPKTKVAEGTESSDETVSEEKPDEDDEKDTDEKKNDEGKQD